MEKIQELKKLLEALGKRYDELELRFRQQFNAPPPKLNPDRIRLFIRLYKINDAIAYFEKQAKRKKNQRRRTTTRKPSRLRNRFYLNRRCKNVLCS